MGLVLSKNNGNDKEAADTATKYYSFSKSLELFQDVGRVWQLVSCTSIDQLCHIIALNHKHTKGQDEEDIVAALGHKRAQMVALETAIQELSTSGQLDFDFLNPNGFYHRLIDCAQKLPVFFPSRTLQCLSQEQGGARVQMTAAQIACILSNAFLGNIAPLPQQDSLSSKPRTLQNLVPRYGYGSLSWNLVYCSRYSGAVQRVKGLLLYLKTALEPDFDGNYHTVTFERVCLDSSFRLEKALQEAHGPLPTVKFSDQGVVEAHHDAACVDFANQQLHVGAVWPSATQEEILFTVFPEAFPGLLFCETMLPNEAILISGLRQFVSTEGFQDTFRVIGPYSVPPANQGRGRTMIAMDASMGGRLHDQCFGRDYCDRDICKAYIGFSSAVRICDQQQQASVIATGNWGCGVFRNNPYVKFLQQLVAASLADVELLFYCLPAAGHIHPDLRHDLEAINAGIRKRNLSVLQIHKELGKYDGAEDRAALRRYILDGFA
jgi:poly(ADP-ribose) glycohydrolase